MGFLSKLVGSAVDLFTGHSDQFLSDTLSNASAPMSLSSGDFSSLAAAGLDYLGGVQTNNANAAQAAANRQFQADQTGTAYQRAVADLKAAGLNPMLAYTNGGASSGGGAQAVMQNAVGSAVHTGLAAKINNAQVENLQVQNDKIQADAGLSRNLSDKALVDISNSTAKTNSDINLNNALSLQSLASARASNASALKIAHEAKLTRLAVPRAQNESDAQSSWWMKNVSPYLSDFLNSANTAAKFAK